MSHPAINWAMRQRGLKPAAKIVLLVLADRYNPAFGCFPDQATIADDAEMSRASVNVHLDALEERGLISRITSVDDATKRQRPTEYVLNFNEKGPESRIRTRPMSRNQTRTESRNQTRAIATGGALGPEDQTRPEPNPVSEIQTRTKNDHTQDVVVSQDAAVSEIQTRDQAGPVSSFQQKPCPDFDESRVQNLDTNLVRVNPVREPVSGGVLTRTIADHGEPTRALYRKALHLVGLNEADRLPKYWMPPFGTQEVDVWLGIAPGVLTPELILEFIAAEQSRKAGSVPDGPRAFTRRLRQLAGDLIAAQPGPITSQHDGASDARSARPSRSTEGVEAFLAGARRLD